MPGHRFGKHIDDSVELENGRQTWCVMLTHVCTHPGPSPHRTHTPHSVYCLTSNHWPVLPSSLPCPLPCALLLRYTVLVYLSGALEGGAQASGGPRAPEAAGKGSKRARKAREPEPPAAAAQEPDRSAVQDLQGGETVFYDERGRRAASIVPRPGLGLLHLHGEDRCMEHEAMGVVRGTKYILRTDIVFE